MQHAQASSLYISGMVSQDRLDIVVEDNGVGFEYNGSTDLNDLLKKGHYGLAGMTERASLINSHLNISQGQNGGTRVQLLWQNPETKQASS